MTTRLQDGQAWRIPRKAYGAVGCARGFRRKLGDGGKNHGGRIARWVLGCRLVNDRERQITRWNGNGSGPGVRSGVGVREFSRGISVSLTTVRLEIVSLRVLLALLLLLLERMEVMLYAIGNVRSIGIAALDSGALEWIGVILRERGVTVIEVSESVRLVRLQVERE